MDKYTLSTLDTLKVNNEIDNILDSESENLLPNKVVAEAIKELRRDKQEMLSDEQKQILEYIIPGDLRSKVGAAHGVAPSINVTPSIFYSKDTIISDGKPYESVSIPVVNEFSNYVNGVESDNEKLIPESEIIVLTYHITNDKIAYIINNKDGSGTRTVTEKTNGNNHLVGIRIRMRFVKDGMYALKLFTQPGQGKPRILRAISKWTHLSENNNYNGQEYTFEFEEPIIASSLRNPGTATDKDSIGLQIAWIPDNDSITFNLQTNYIEKFEIDNIPEETLAIIKNLCPQIAFYVISEYKTKDKETINSHGCWYYDSNRWGVGTGPHIDVDATFLYASATEEAVYRNQEDTIVIKDVNIDKDAGVYIQGFAFDTKEYNRKLVKLSLKPCEPSIQINVNKQNVSVVLTDSDENYVGTSQNSFYFAKERFDTFAYDFIFNNIVIPANNEVYVYFVNSEMVKGDKRDLEVIKEPDNILAVSTCRRIGGGKVLRINNRTYNWEAGSPSPYYELTFKDECILDVTPQIKYGVAVADMATANAVADIFGFSFTYNGVNNLLTGIEIKLNELQPTARQDPQTTDIKNLTLILAEAPANSTAYTYATKSNSIVVDSQLMAFFTLSKNIVLDKSKKYRIAFVKTADTTINPAMIADGTANANQYRAIRAYLKDAPSNNFKCYNNMGAWLNEKNWTLHTFNLITETRYTLNFSENNQDILTVTNNKNSKDISISNNALTIHPSNGTPADYSYVTIGSENTNYIWIGNDGDETSAGSNTAIFGSEVNLAATTSFNTNAQTIKIGSAFVGEETTSCDNIELGVSSTAITINGNATIKGERLMHYNADGSTVKYLIEGEGGQSDALTQSDITNKIVKDDTGLSDGGTIYTAINTAITAHNSDATHLHVTSEEKDTWDKVIYDDIAKKVFNTESSKEYKTYYGSKIKNIITNADEISIKTIITNSPTDTPFYGYLCEEYLDPKIKYRVLAKSSNTFIAVNNGENEHIFKNVQNISGDTIFYIISTNDVAIGEDVTYNIEYDEPEFKIFEAPDFSVISSSNVFGNLTITKEISIIQKMSIADHGNDMVKHLTSNEHEYLDSLMPAITATSTGLKINRTGNTIITGAGLLQFTGDNYVKYFTQNDLSAVDSYGTGPVAGKTVYDYFIGDNNQGILSSHINNNDIHITSAAHTELNSLLDVTNTTILEDSAGYPIKILALNGDNGDNGIKVTTKAQYDAAYPNNTLTTTVIGSGAQGKGTSGISIQRTSDTGFSQITIESPNTFIKGDMKLAHWYSNGKFTNYLTEDCLADYTSGQTIQIATTSTITNHINSTTSKHLSSEEYTKLTNLLNTLTADRLEKLIAIIENLSVVE